RTTGSGGSLGRLARHGELTTPKRRIVEGGWATPPPPACDPASLARCTATATRAAGGRDCWSRRLSAQGFHRHVAAAGLPHAARVHRLEHMAAKRDRRHRELVAKEVKQQSAKVLADRQPDWRERGAL